MPPESFASLEDTIWGVRSGRGFGKTLLAANWLGLEACDYPSYYHVVSPTHDDVRYTCFEGPTGLLSCIPPQLIVNQNLSLPSITLWNGSIIRGFAGDTPERLRGPQCAKAWCFPGGTPVLLANGRPWPIQELSAGDRVATRGGPKRVLAAKRTKSKAELWKLVTQKGKILYATPEHEIFCHRGFISLCDLESGDLLSEYRGVDMVASVSPTTLITPVYNLEIEGAHEFYAHGLLVHNCDEIASWKYPEQAWSNLLFGLRLGDAPQVVWTGTPKPTPFVRKLQEEKRSIVTTGTTYENRENLHAIFYQNVAKYEGTKIGRQELHGEVLDPEEEGFVKRSQWRLWPADKPLPKFEFLIYSMDTAFTEQTHDRSKHLKQTLEPENDPTAVSVWGLFSLTRKGRFEKNILLLDAWEDWLGYPDLIKRVRRERQLTYGDSDEPVYKAKIIPKASRAGHQGRKIDLILIEQKGSGISLIQSLATENILAQAYNPGREDKLTRLHLVSPLWPHGRVWAPESELNPGKFKSWADPVISQVCSYLGEGSIDRDDLLDTTTQALRYFMDHFIGPLTELADAETEARRKAQLIENRRAKVKSNPYE